MKTRNVNATRTEQNAANRKLVQKNNSLKKPHAKCTVECPACGGKTAPATLYRVELSTEERTELLAASAETNSKWVREPDAKLNLDHVYVTDSAYCGLRGKGMSVFEWLWEGTHRTRWSKSKSLDKAQRDKSETILCVNTMQLLVASENQHGHECVGFISESLRKSSNGEPGGAIALFAPTREAILPDWLAEVLKNPPPFYVF